MDYVAKDFEKLLIPCYDLKQGMDPFEVFPALKLYKEFKKPLDKLSFTKVLKFIAFLYDKESPLHQTIPDFTQRSIEAAILAKWPIDDESKRFTESYMEILKNENPNVLSMIIRYCRMQGEMIFSQLIIMDEIYYGELKQLKESTDSHTRQRAIQNTKNLRTEIDNLRRELFKQNTSQSLEKLLFKEIEGDNLGISPEEIAAIYDEGGNVLEYKKYASKKRV